MNRAQTIKIVTIAFFVGLNMILGVYFLITVRGSQYVPLQIKEKLEEVGMVAPKSENGFPLDPAPDYSQRIDLSPDSVITAVNEQRQQRNNKELQNSSQLHLAAVALLQELKVNNFDLTDTEADDLLAKVLKDQNYNYSVAFQSVVIGPISTQSVIDYWLDDDDSSLFHVDVVTDIGVATIVEAVDGQFTGFTAVLLAKPFNITTNTTPPASVAPTLPMVSDQEVIDALNAYRATHGVKALNVNQDLCSYAQKRVGDLVAFGGLDNHRGFQEDFADPEKKPAELGNYNGTAIGENLAHQFCRNMTTGDSFVAETGTALIEWCFDSSTKGHREAQLSTDYKNVCVRHADGMYVVTFGN